MQRERIGFLESSVQISVRDLLYRDQSIWTPDPNHELSPVIAVDKGLPGFTRAEMIDLHQLGEGRLVYFHCVNPHAFYTIRREPLDMIKMWRDWSGDTTGLVGKVDDLAVMDQETYDQHNGTITIYPGMLFATGSRRIQPRINLPYFKYDNHRRVLTPDESWIDFVRGIFVQSKT